MLALRPVLGRRRTAAASSSAITTTAGKWSVMHMAFTLAEVVALPDGTDGLSEGQQATMLGLYSEFAY
jgi:hypothetical protein